MQGSSWHDSSSRWPVSCYTFQFLIASLHPNTSHHWCFPLRPLRLPLFTIPSIECNNHSILLSSSVQVNLIFFSRLFIYWTFVSHHQLFSTSLHPLPCFPILSFLFFSFKTQILPTSSRLLRRSSSVHVSALRNRHTPYKNTSPVSSSTQVRALSKTSLPVN